MGDWRATGQAGWCEETGNAVYHITKGSASLNKGDHDDLEALLAGWVSAGENSYDKRLL